MREPFAWTIWPWSAAACFQFFWLRPAIWSSFVDNLSPEVLMRVMGLSTTMTIQLMSLSSLNSSRPLRIPSVEGVVWAGVLGARIVVISATVSNGVVSVFIGLWWGLLGEVLLGFGGGSYGVDVSVVNASNTTGPEFVEVSFIIFCAYWGVDCADFCDGVGVLVVACCSWGTC